MLHCPYWEIMLSLLAAAFWLLPPVLPHLQAVWLLCAKQEWRGTKCSINIIVLSLGAKSVSSLLHSRVAAQLGVREELCCWLFPDTLSALLVLSRDPQRDRKNPEEVDRIFICLLLSAFACYCSTGAKTIE